MQGSFNGCCLQWIPQRLVSALTVAKYSLVSNSSPVSSAVSSSSPSITSGSSCQWEGHATVHDGAKLVLEKFFDMCGKWKKGDKYLTALPQAL